MNYDFRRAWIYLGRACLLKCPECGTRPVFLPLLRIRRLSDYFTPLDGCPRCGYPYEREMGYFLLAIWAINYGFGSLLGIGIYCYLEFFHRLPLSSLLIGVITPVVLFNFLFARHSKALFLAFDHYFDPHTDGGSGGGGGGGGGGKNNPPARPVPAAPVDAPTPAEPAMHG